MSRQITIGYRDATGNDVPIEIRAPYFLFGCQQTSLDFWSNPYLKEIGIKRLTILGESDPLYFSGWDDMALLGREIELLSKHLAKIDSSPEIKASWLSHLTYCYHLLSETAPRESMPQLTIG
jgi:hypothetical protein